MERIQRVRGPFARRHCSVCGTTIPKRRWSGVCLAHYPLFRRFRNGLLVRRWRAKEAARNGRTYRPRGVRDRGIGKMRI